jgi:triosephosphate isomerase
VVAFHPENASVSLGIEGGSRATHGALAIICIGETKSQRLDGKALSVCGDQIAGSVPEGITASSIAIGYEPLWAKARGSGFSMAGRLSRPMHTTFWRFRKLAARW